MTNSAYCDQFKGTERFVIERRIGAGGMGVVYRAYDRERDELVALKTLRDVDPTALYRLKREFRTMADLVHTNLVRLYELFSVEGQWFFTMELIDGATFLDYVRWGTMLDDTDSRVLETGGLSADASRDETGRRTEATRADSTPVSGKGDQTPPPPGPVTGGFIRPTGGAALETAQLKRHRAALCQLAAGLVFLHEAGRLHRDLKPSNVLVARDGRAVILDFGLATELAGEDQIATTGNLIVGTAPYMSPEQAAGKPLTPASDWYSFGGMVYEALTGRSPFIGRPLEILMDKQAFEPPSPKEVVAGVPEDLDALCAALLRRDPDARPSGAEVLERLGRPANRPQQVAPPRRRVDGPEAPFLGRQTHLGAIRDALAAVQGGRTVVMYVRGESGVGKTALVRRVLRRLRGSGDTVVLAGRCYERESVPYKALDTLADALSHHLVGLSPLEADALMPRDVGALSQVFPVLRRVETIAEGRGHAPSIPDKQELRERAFRALRELLTRLGDRKTLVLHIDDFQWGDLDSVALLEDLLRPPDPPALLLIVCYRSEDEGTSPALRAMLESSASGGWGMDVRQIDVGPLSREDARQLALALLPPESPHAEGLSDAIARESSGNPYFVDALVRHLQAGTESSDPCSGVSDSSLSTRVRLDDVLWQRTRDLAEEAQRLLEVIAVAGHPVSLDDAGRAAGLSGKCHETADLLRAAHLVRATGDAQEPEIETYHDRVREAVVAHLPGDALARYHRQLALALRASGRADAATLAAHYVAGAEPAEASRWYALAADRATEGLAFDHAAELYGLALDLQAAPDDRTRHLRRKLAHALANAGRGAEAGRQYLVAATEFGPADAVELQRCAATQFLTSGHIDEGLAALHNVFAAQGMSVPTSTGRALRSLLVRRAYLRMRGLGFRETAAGQISPTRLAQVDACWSAAIGLTVVAPVFGADFQTRGLLLALRCGEPYRIACFLSLGALLLAMEGERNRRRAEKLLQEAARLARRVDRPHADALVRFAAGAAACLTGRWKHSIETCDQATKLLRDHCTGVAWELDTANAFALWSLFWAGEIGELTRRFPVLLSEARRRGTLYVLANLNTFVCAVTAFAADEPHRAGPVLQEQMARWTLTGFHVQHMHGLYSRVLIDTYLGKGRAAWMTMKREYPSLKRSRLMRIQLVRMMIHEARARSALSAATEGKDAASLLRHAERDARRLEREKSCWGRPAAATTRAGIAMVIGNTPRAVSLLRDAIAGFEAVDMALHATTARRRLGQLLGGEEGRSMVQEADRWMASQQILNPDRMTGLYVPGLA